MTFYKTSVLLFTFAMLFSQQIDAKKHQSIVINGYTKHSKVLSERFTRNFQERTGDRNKGIHAVPAHNSGWVAQKLTNHALFITDDEKRQLVRVSLETGASTILASKIRSFVLTPDDRSVLALSNRFMLITLQGGAVKTLDSSVTRNIRIDQFKISPDGHHAIIYFSQDGWNNKHQLASVPLDGSPIIYFTPKQERGFEINRLSIEFSEDGRHAYYLSDHDKDKKQNIFRVELNSGKHQLINRKLTQNESIALTTPTRDSVGFLYSHAQNILIYGTYDSRKRINKLYSANLSTGKVIPLVSNINDNFEGMIALSESQLTSNGNYLVFKGELERSNEGLYMVPVVGGPIKQLNIVIGENLYFEIDYVRLIPNTDQVLISSRKRHNRHLFDKRLIFASYQTPSIELYSAKNLSNRIGHDYVEVFETTENAIFITHRKTRKREFSVYSINVSKKTPPKIIADLPYNIRGWSFTLANNGNVILFHGSPLKPYNQKKEDQKRSDDFITLYAKSLASKSSPVITINDASGENFNSFSIQTSSQQKHIIFDQTSTSERYKKQLVSVDLNMLH